MKKQLIFLHGALGAKEQFSALQRILTNYDILTFDFEGHGSAKSGERPLRIEYFAENLLNFLDENDIESANIFGYSMGGYVALYLAATEPERISSIFTLATKFAWNPDSSRKEAGMLDAEKIGIKVPKYADFLQTLHGERWRSLLAETAEMMMYLGNHATLGADILSNIQTKTRIAVGDKDTMVSIEETVEVFRALPNAELQIFPHTPHPFEKVSLDLLIPALREFFGES